MFLQSNCTLKAKEEFSNKSGHQMVYVHKELYTEEVNCYHSCGTSGRPSGRSQMPPSLMLSDQHHCIKNKTEHNSDGRKF